MRKFTLLLMFLVAGLASFAQCPAVSEFSESFDASDAMPECWSTLRVNPPFSSFAVVEVQTNPSNSFSPPNSVRMFNQLGADADFYLISPEVDNLGEGTHQLRFVYRGQPNTEGEDAIIEVGTMTDTTDESTFTLVETLSGTSDEFQEFTVPFDQVSTGTHLAIKADFQVSFRNIHFDDVTWEPIPTCPKPTELEALNITSTSADLSWTAGGSETEWEIEYGEAGFDPETEGTTITDTDDLGETIEGLSIGTDYEFYVKAVCSGEDQSIWSFAGAFATLCDIYPLDYAQGFATFIPNCWTQADAGDPTSGPATPGTSNWVDVDYLNDEANGRAVKIILYGNSVSDWLISPEIDLDGSAELSYDVGITTLNGTTAPEALGADDQIQVLISTDDGTTWEALKTYDNTAFPSGEGLTETIDLSAYSGTAKFAFWATDGSASDSPASYDVFFDNFAVNALVLPCQAPSDIVVDNISDSGAMISWTENGDATSWEVLYGGEGFDPNSQGNSEVAGPSAELELTDLNGGTAYDVYVRAICAEADSSEWVGPETFTTSTNGIADIAIDGFHFYPNPAQDQLTISANVNLDGIAIYSALGNLVFQSTAGAINHRVDVSELSAGVYILQVTSAEKTQMVRFLKE